MRHTKQIAWGERAVSYVEGIINWRRRRREKRRERSRANNQIVEWIKAFVWAAMMVLLINQYLLQAYRIPSGSMRDTLLQGDRLFVGKFIFGPEILPGIAKIRLNRVPKQGEVIIFENPSYLKRGVVYTIFQRVIYMLSLSLIDLDRNAAGNQRAQLLIKRLISTAHDQIRLDKGNFYFRSAATGEWMDEQHYQTESGLEYATERLLSESEYAIYRAGSRLFALQEAGIALTEQERATLNQFISTDAIDAYFFEHIRNRTLLSINPHEYHRLYRHERAHAGWYIPTGYFLPLGDNRDNSRDGRYFGIVSKDDVLGKARFIYWPLRRISIIQ